MVFTARQLQEKCQEQTVDLYMTFVDLSKAFDTFSVMGFGKLWQSGTRYRGPGEGKDTKCTYTQKKVRCIFDEI